MGCIGSLCRKIFIGILSLIKVAICIAIICIVTLQLYHTTVNITPNTKKFSVKVDCLMTGSVRGDTVCEYTYAVCGISMALSFVSSILLCVTCDACGLGDWVNFIIGALQTAWWVIASIVISKNVRDSNNFVFPEGGKLPKEDWRNAVAVLSWINVAGAGLIALLFLFQACKCLKDCCSCCCGDDDSKHGNKV